MDQEIITSINNQINAELESAYLYFAMAAYCEAEGHLGAAHWMKMQAQEEMGHTTKFYQYVNNIGGRVELQAIAEPPKEFGTIINTFKEVLAHEKFITKKIYDLYTLATEQKNYAFQVFLQWFINEQVEEEATVSEIITKIESVGDSKQALFMIDKELGERASQGEEAE